MNYSGTFTVVITTYDRPAVLERTLGKLCESPLAVCRVIIVDDGGLVPLLRKHMPSSLDIVLIRHETRAGLVIRRTEANLMASTPYVFSLDDDSFPESIDLDSILAIFDLRENVAAVSFSVRRPDGTWQIAPKASPLVQTKGFIGCAHVLDRSKFARLNGYNRHLIHQGEEFEYAARAFARDWICFHHSPTIFVHEATQVARDHRRIRYFEARNKILWLRAFCPNVLKPLYFIRAIIDLSRKLMLPGRSRIFPGILSGFTAQSATAEFSTTFNQRQFCQWRELPYY